MAYDEGRHQIVMYGNRNPYTADLGVTWTWNGTDWAEADRTGDLLAEKMVYDGKIGSIVAFNFFTSMPESRLWNGTRWSAPIYGSPTPPRANFAVAYDPVSGNVVVFGGKTEFPPATLGDTWTWDGSQWTQQHPATSPTPRHLATMAYDPGSKKVLLFGGLTTDQWSTETWSWDGSTWTQLAPSARPPAVAYVAAADPRTGGILVLGETPIMSPPPSPFGCPPPFHWEQWLWTGSTWQAQVAGAHPDRLPAPNAYDENNRNTVAVIWPGAPLPLATWILG
jgi:hypothetical protein